MSSMVKPNGLLEYRLSAPNVPESVNSRTLRIDHAPRAAACVAQFGQRLSLLVSSIS